MTENFDDDLADLSALDEASSFEKYFSVSDEDWSYRRATEPESTAPVSRRDLPERERQPLPEPTVLPTGGNIAATEPVFRTPLHANWASYLSATGFDWEYRDRPDAAFTLHGRVESNRRVHLVIANRRSIDGVRRMSRARGATATSRRSGTRLRADLAPVSGRSDWTIAVGTNPALRAITWETSIFNWRDKYPDPDHAEDIGVEYVRHRQQPWLWFRDIVGIVVSGEGIQAGDPMSIAQCPVCGAVAFVPLDGWSRHPLHPCGHRDANRALPVIYGLMPAWNPY
ncbi:hypothetical protein [Rhodococcus sp. NPDC006774]|uniref:hypothetical protein n=1 Tax=Rhodococcus sp. NPDC006774 TaxID=3157186 RepID=UPI0033D88674